MKFGEKNYDPYYYGMPQDQMENGNYPYIPRSNDYGLSPFQHEWSEVPQNNYQSPFSRFKERSINREMIIGQQVEQRRAEITAQALANTANLVEYEQTLMNSSPAASEFFQQILNDYVDSVGNTIASFGRPQKNYFNNNRRR